MKSRVRTIAVVTGSRAEFGLLASVIDAIQKQRGLRLRLIVTGAHLTTGTWREINHWYEIDAKVKMQMEGRVGRAEDVAALGWGIAGLGKVFTKLRPDVVLVLGDRIEALAAACAASVGGFRLAHIHGGDRAEGVADEAMRHAISKMAHLHFAATTLSRERLIRMGEPPEVVWNVGSPAVDVFRRPRYRVLLQGDHYAGALILQHPIGDSNAVEAERMRQTIAAVESLHQDVFKDKDRSYILLPNSDPGSEGIRRVIEKRVPTGKYRGGESPPFRAFRHLHRIDFLQHIAFSEVIVGNSSAGLIEAAAMKTPCVNIGPRQNGREKPGNVVDSDYGEANVRRAIRKALRLDLRRMKHPYGDGRAGERIAAVLAGVDMAKVGVRKRNSY